MKPHINILEKKSLKRRLYLILILTALELIIMLFGFANCRTNCYKFIDFANPCLVQGSLYCCKRYEYQLNCNENDECLLDNSSCIWFIIIGSINSVILLISLIDFFNISWL